MHTAVAIVGGGLSGLVAARRLHARGVDVTVLEARARLGGRILSADETGTPSEDGFDLGPSWFWPHAQPGLAALVGELGLATFAQHSAGDLMFERMSRERPSRYRPADQDSQSFRLVGGTQTLVAALAASLPEARIRTGVRMSGLALSGRRVDIRLAGAAAPDEVFTADQVIAALPPRLLADVSLVPGIDPVCARRWRETPTWMAPHAKFFAIYDRPFWRDAGLSGTAQSFVGPLSEVHDASTASGKAALFGFVGLGVHARVSLGEPALTAARVEQLVRIFGAEASHPRATLIKDWASDPLTAAPLDAAPGGHPQVSGHPWVTGPWCEVLSLAGSETSTTEPGYLAGAVSAAERAVAEVLARLTVRG